MAKKIEAGGYIVTDGHTLLGAGETPEAAALDALTSGGTRPLDPAARLAPEFAIEPATRALLVERDAERWSTVDGVHCTIEEAGEA